MVEELQSLLLCLLSLELVTARNLEQPRYDTAYACEGTTLHIDCQPGEIIHLIRANYGRFSITICNDHGNTDWSVNCMSPKSLRVLHTKCSHQQNCTVQASTLLFSDPCPGTLKYLEAHYLCMPATLTTTTARPSPPWLISSQPTVWSTAKAATLRPPLPTSSGGGGGGGGGIGGGNAGGTTKMTPPTTTTVATTSTTVISAWPPQQAQPPDTPPPETPPPAPPEEQPSSAAAATPPPPPQHSSSPESSDQEEMCEQVAARGIIWNTTRAGEWSVVPCPGGSTGAARWSCLPGAIRPPVPDLSECRSLWLTSLDARIQDGDAIISIATDLAQVTDSKALYGGDMMTTTHIMKKLAKKMSADIQTFPDQRQREAIVTELLHGVLKTGSNLLDVSALPSWRDLSHQEQMRVATSLLVGIEENSFLLADTVVREKTVPLTEKNILLKVRVVEASNIDYEVFSFGGPGGSGDWSGDDNWLRLERAALIDNRSEGNLLRIVYSAFDRLNDILTIPGGSQSAATIPLPDRIVNSKVISASLGKGRHIQLSRPVTICLKHLQVDNVTNPSCVYWDYTMNSWSEEGCRVESTNMTHTICSCDHLTNFAILMDVRAIYLPPAHSVALQIITYVGCIISIICLFSAILTFQLFRGLKSERTTIHKNLCFCLLIGEVLFVAGIDQTDYALVCSLIAALLHYFFLAAFVWMFLEGFQLYAMLIEVFEAEKSRVRWYYPVGYGAPLVVVVASWLWDGGYGYGTETSCWLRTENGFIFSFVGPVAAVIAANLVFLSMAVWAVCRHAGTAATATAAQIKTKEHSRLASARVWLRGAVILVFVLGLTWTFGLLYLSQVTVIMAYIFTTLNTLQGLFIFLFHCLLNDKAQKEYRKMLRRHSWLASCVGYKEGSGGLGGVGGSSGGVGGALSGTTSAGSSDGKDRRSSALYSASGPAAAVHHHHHHHHHDRNITAPSTPPNQTPYYCGSSGGVGGGSHWSDEGGIGGNAIDIADQQQQLRGSRAATPGGDDPPYYPQPQPPIAATSWAMNKPFMWKVSHSEATSPVEIIKPEKRKNISFKSYNRDAYDESGRCSSLSTNSLRGSGGKGGNYLSGVSAAATLQHCRTGVAKPHHHHHHHRGGGVNGSLYHTYQEIGSTGGGGRGDPVYEEICRSGMGGGNDLSGNGPSGGRGSDGSDEDRRVTSDMSRQSSRHSSSDNRPLIPASFHSAFDAAFKARLREQQRAAASTVAVLDGQTVVCHLQPHHVTQQSSMHHQPYSEC